jgi:hypothetical protein
MSDRFFLTTNASIEGGGGCHKFDMNTPASPTFGRVAHTGLVVHTGVMKPIDPGFQIGVRKPEMERSEGAESAPTA